MGNTIVAATREIIKATTEVKRFWFVQDERGLVHRLLDEQGATYWQARWDASGWRTLVGAPQPNMWVPFGFPNQIILDGTQSFSRDTPTSSEGQSSAAIVLNVNRSYDPLVGSFMQGEPIDLSGEPSPQAYSYSKHSPIQYHDPDGLSPALNTVPYDILYGPASRYKRCRFWQRMALASAIAQGIAELNTCNNGLCDLLGGGNLKRWASLALARVHMQCYEMGDGSSLAVNPDGYFINPFTLGTSRAESDHTSISLPPAAFRFEMWNPKKSSGAHDFTLNPRAGDQCLRRTVIHEAIHVALKHTKFGASPAPPISLPWSPRPDSHFAVMEVFQNIFYRGFEERMVQKMVGDCVTCKKAK